MPSKEAGLIEGPRYSLEELGRLQDLLTPSQRENFEQQTKGRYLTPDQMGEILEKLVSDSTEMAEKFEKAFIQQLTPQEQQNMYSELHAELQTLSDTGHIATAEQLDRIFALGQRKDTPLIDKIIEAGALIKEIKQSGGK